jgi:hypothetical protein
MPDLMSGLLILSERAANERAALKKRKKRSTSTNTLRYAIADIVASSIIRKVSSLQVADEILKLVQQRQP